MLDGVGIGSADFILFTNVFSQILKSWHTLQAPNEYEFTLYTAVKKLSKRQRLQVVTYKLHTRVTGDGRVSRKVTKRPS